MSVIQPPTAVLLPGTGSDEVFVRAVFQAPVSALGARLLTPAPVPGPGLAEAYLTCLDAAAAAGPVIAGGISFGAHLAAAWALRNPDRCTALLLALPAWTGSPDGAPAAAAARHSAADIRARGTAAALASAIQGTPDWLAAELTRTWPRYGDALAASLEAAAAHPAPTLPALSTLPIPTGIACFTDDPIHPEPTAHAWTTALPRAALTTVPLSTMQTDLSALGHATVQSLQRALAM
ncbi:alpha/beta fold hydrolase [Actinokineospora sp. NPDC004072]